MRRTARILAVALALVLMTTTAAYGGKFHFKSSFFSSGSLTFEGVGVGLGNTEYFATLDAKATVRALCVNGYGQEVLGKNAIKNVSGPQDQIVQTEDRGKTLVSLTVEEPAIEDLYKAPKPWNECPYYGYWSINEIVVTEWTSAKLVIKELGTHDLLYGQSFECSGGGVKVDHYGHPVRDESGELVIKPVSCTEA